MSKEPTFFYHQDDDFFGCSLWWVVRVASEDSKGEHTFIFLVTQLLIFKKKKIARDFFSVVDPLEGHCVQ